MTVIYEQPKSSNMRAIFLVGLAAVIAGFYFIDLDGLFESEVSDSLVSGSKVEQRLAQLRSYEAIADHVNQTFSSIEEPYITKMVNVPGLNDTGTDTKAFVENKITEMLEFYKLKNLAVKADSITFSKYGNYAPYVKEFEVDVSFTSNSNIDPLAVLMQFSTPDGGVRWKTFEMSADRRTQEIIFTGTLSVLGMEIAG